MFLGFLTVLVMSCVARAQDAVDMPLQEFLSLVFKSVHEFGGLSWGLKVGAVIMLLISSMKVSLVRQWTWDKIPAGIKPMVAPILGAIAGLASLGKWDVPSIVAWAMAGAGAVLLDQILDGVKQMPGIGPKYIAVIDFISKLLKKPSA